MEKLEAAIEAILFSAGDSVETGRIAKAIGQDKTTTEKIIRNMMLKYNARDRGIKILELDGAFQLCTKKNGASRGIQSSKFLNQIIFHQLIDRMVTFYTTDFFNFLFRYRLFICDN